MVKIVLANQDLHAAQIRELFWEYLQYANSRINEEFGVNFDIQAILEDDMLHLTKFMPPEGCLLLAVDGDRPAGIACLKYLAPAIGEIKRMYVRPGDREQGLGHMLVDGLLEEAAHIGYERVRLDSAGFMKEAHRLYQRAGFKSIEAYEGSEIPKDFQQHWVFMEKDLRR